MDGDLVGTVGLLKHLNHPRAMFDPVSFFVIPDEDLIKPRSDRVTVVENIRSMSATADK